MLWSRTLASPTVVSPGFEAGAVLSLFRWSPIYFSSRVCLLKSHPELPGKPEGHVYRIDAQQD